MKIAIILSVVATAIALVSLGLSIKAIVECAKAKGKFHQSKIQREYDILQIKGLTNCHKMTSLGYESLRIPPTYEHLPSKADTESIFGVTLEELANLILDGTPIKRDVPESKEYGVYKTVE